jgi:hypothetical protein
VILEFHEISKVAMIVQQKTLVVRFDLCHKVIVYLKDEFTNLNALTNVLTNIVSCTSLMFSPLHVGNYYEHIMFKCC